MNNIAYCPKCDSIHGLLYDCTKKELEPSTQKLVKALLGKAEYDPSFKELGDKIAEKQPDSVGITDKRSVVVKQNEKEHNKIWNAAIEAAALIADEADEIASIAIRKLKK